MGVTATALSKFCELFQGNRSAYGVHIPAKTVEGVKEDGKSFTRTERVTSSIYQGHIEGKISIGIVPIDVNGNVKFCAIDVDKYPLNPASYCKILDKYNIPLVPFRSKSGGLHLYLFFETETPAEKAVNILDDFRCILGLPKDTETFPKQKKLAPNKVGNWINLPYFDGNKTSRYAYDSEGHKLSFEAAMDLAYSMRTSINALQFILSSIPMNTAPPCLQAMFVNDVVTKENKNRNVFLFNTAVYLKARFKEEWKEKLSRVNESLPDPLTEGELISTIIASHDKGSYTYQCEQSCIGEWCDKTTCSKREFGKNQAKVSNFTFEKLIQVQSNPPYYKWIVSGKEMVFFSESDLRNQDKFMDYCIRYLRYLPNKLKNDAWAAIINEALKSMEIEEVSVDDDLSDASMWQVYLKEFIFERALASRPSQISLGQVYHDEKGYWFRAEAFVQYLQDVKKFKAFSAKETGYMLRKMGFEPGRIYDTTDKRAIRCWTCTDSVMKNMTGTSIKNEEVVSDEKTARKVYDKMQTIKRKQENKLKDLAEQLINYNVSEESLLDFSEEKEPF